MPMLPAQSSPKAQLPFLRCLHCSVYAVLLSKVFICKAIPTAR